MPQPLTHISEGEEYPAHLERMYAWMQAYIENNGFPPTTHELVDAGFARSTSVVVYYLKKMQEFGMLARTHRIVRGIRLHPRKVWKKHATSVPHVYQQTPERKPKYANTD